MVADKSRNSRIFKLVHDCRKQYSIWPVDLLNPPGWRDASRFGPKPEGLLANGDRAETARFVIEPVTDSLTAAGAAYVRDEVFGREWKLQTPPLFSHDGGGILTLVARPERQSEPVAVVSVVETTGHHALHRRLGLTFHEGARVARYMQLAVLKPYRGLSIPVQLVLEARRQFVAPRRIDSTWLLFDADRARGSSFCRVLGFRASSKIFHTEYGRSRVLVWNERGAFTEPENGRVYKWLPTRGAAADESGPPSGVYGVADIRADEWVAH